MALRCIKGFGLWESLLVLSILAMLSLFVFPGLSKHYKKNQFQVLEKELISAILISRQLAFLSGKTLTLNPNPKTQCWGDGMVLFEDTKNHKFNENAIVRRRWDWSYLGVELTWKGFQNKDYLIFSPDITKASANGRFVLKIPWMSKTFVVNRFGRIKEYDTLA